MNEMTLREFARMGGLATKKKYGKEHFKKLRAMREAKKQLGDNSSLTTSRKRSKI